MSYLEDTLIKIAEGRMEKKNSRRNRKTSKLDSRGNTDI